MEGYEGQRHRYGHVVAGEALCGTGFEWVRRKARRAARGRPAGAVLGLAEGVESVPIAGPLLKWARPVGRGPGGLAGAFT